VTGSKGREGRVGLVDKQLCRVRPRETTPAAKRRALVS